jgi:hypothetical protein
MKIKAHERGLLWREGDLVAVLRPGVHWYLDPLLKLRLQIVTPREAWLVHKDLDIIARSGKLGSDAVVVDLNDSQRALVWIDNRFARILGPGLYVLWTVEHAVRVEIVDARAMQLVHRELPVIVRSPGQSR